MTTVAEIDESPAEPAARPGRSELGAVTIDNRVVAKIAAHAAVEVPDAGAATPRILGRTVGAGVPGVRQSDLSSLPKVSVDVDMSVVALALSISVRWPASVPDVAAQVRGRITQRLAELTGLTVTEINLSVTDFVTDLAAPPRVR